MVTSRGNILHVMDVIEEHCTSYKTAGSGFYLHRERKQRSSKRGGRLLTRGREQTHKHV